MSNYFYCLSLGMASCLGFPPFNLFFITLINIAISLFLLSKITQRKQAFYMGLLFGLGYHFSGLYWISISFEIADTGGYFLGISAVLFLSLFLAIFQGLSYFLIRIFVKDFFKINAGICIILVLSFFDWTKGNIFWGFPWMPLSSIWSFSSYTLYPFSIIGIWGYTLISFSLVVAILLIFRRTKLFFLFIFPFLITSSIIFIPFNNLKNNQREISVRLVQPNIEQKKKWEVPLIDEHIRNLFYLSSSKGIKTIDLVIWPETSVPFDITSKNKKAIEFNNKIKNFNSIIFGAVRREVNKEGLRIYNTLYFKKSDEKKFKYHDKVKLVPFGEFIPFRNILGFNKITDGNLDFQKGKKIKPIKLAEEVFAMPMICYEVIFPSKFTNKEFDYNLLINITNDGWYGNSTGPYQHLALSRIRAVQEGRTLIRVANTGISAIIDSEGKILSSLNLDSEGKIDSKVKLLVVNTLYKKYGEGFFYLSLLILSLILLLINVKKNRSS